MSTRTPFAKTSLKRLRAPFVDHPSSIGEGYFEHFFNAMRFAVILSSIAAAAVVHAIIPSLCQSTARLRIAALHEELQSRSPAHNE